MMDKETDVSTVSVEEKALELGWRPKEEYKGDPEKFVSAEEFVKRGENIMPILKANNAKLLESNKKMSGDITELKQTLSEMGEMLSSSEKRAYDKAIADIEAQQRQAVEDG